MAKYELIVGYSSWTLPEQWQIDDLAEAGPDEPITLSMAPFLPEIGVAWSEKVLRGAITRGELPAERVGRSIYVTRRGIAAWREQCRVAPKARKIQKIEPRDAGKSAVARASAMSALNALKGKR